MNNTAQLIGSARLEADTLREDLDATQDTLRRGVAHRDELHDALWRLVNSDPQGAIATASEDVLCEAANDMSADPIVREQAASMLQARAVLAKGES